MTLADTANAAVTRDALAAAQRLTNPTQGETVTTDQTDHRAEAEGWLAHMLNATTMRNEKQAHRWATAHLLAAIHDEQQLQTGTLADLRGAIDDLAEVLRPMLPESASESVTVTLPRDVANKALTLRDAAAQLDRHNRHHAATIIRALADALDAANTPPASQNAAQDDPAAGSGSPGGPDGERAADRRAAAILREFARNQDSWREAGRAEQVITRRAMRNALLREADRIQFGSQS